MGKYYNSRAINEGFGTAEASWLRVTLADATGEEWRKYTIAGGATTGDAVAAWDDVSPVHPGSQPTALGPSSYKIADYDKFFKNYIVSPNDSYGKDNWLANKKPSKEYVTAYGNTAGTSAESLAALNALDTMDFTDETGFQSLDSGNNAWMSLLYQLFEALTGLKAPLLPTDCFWDECLGHRNGNPTVFSLLYGSWHPTAITDFADYLLYLYLETPNKKRDALREVDDLINESGVKALAKDEAPIGAIEALKVKLAKDILSSANKGKVLSEAQLQALRALKKGNDEYFSKRIRESDQCILRLNLESFMRPYYENRYQAQNGLSPTRRKRPHKSIYQDSGHPVASMNKLAYSPASAPFLQARTHEISQLMPMIRLYKTYYNDETKEIDKEVELYFDGGVSAAQALSGRTGVGIKNFEWSLNATNPSTVKNDITAKLVLYFQSFNDLLSTRWGKDVITGKAEKFRYEDLLLRPPAGGRDKDLGSISAPDTGACEKNTADSDSRFYEVKATVGWAPPIRFEGQQTPGLVTAMRSQQIPLFLTLIDHEFSFTQEGTFELSITYRARMEAMGMDPRLDILTTPKIKDRVNTLQKEIQNLKKICDSQESIDKKREEIALERGIDADNLASNIITQLEGYIYFSKIKTAPLQDSVLGIATTEEVVSNLVISELDVNNSITATNKTLKKDVLLELRRNTVVTPKKGTSEAKKAKEKEAEKDPTDFSFDDEDTVYSNIPWFYFGDLVDIVVNNAMVNNTPGDQDAPGIIPGLELDNLVFLLGTYDYEKIEKNGSSMEIGQLSSVPVTVAAYNSWFVRNIVNSERSSFPILEFLRSFIKEVILPMLNRDCFNDEVFRTTWTTSDYYKRLPRPWIEISPLISKSAAISIASNQGPLTAAERGKNKLGDNPLEKFRVTPGPSPFSTGFARPTKLRVTAAEINLGNFNPDTGNIPTTRENSHGQTIKNSYHVTVFYLIGQDAYKTLGRVVVPTEEKEKSEFVKTYDFNSDGEFSSFEMYAAREDRDYKQGVYHLYLGADRGLVKEATFAKVDVPYLREARIQQDGLNPLALLAATYNINLKMVGNTVFWPGQYIFVNPVGYGSGLGLPDQCGSVSNQLGLGGYHLITQVKSYIENGKFETTIKGLFEFSGDGKPSLPQHTPDNECSEDSSMAGSAQEVSVPS